MYVSSAKDRSKLLVAVITGGRPKLSQRPTSKFLESLRAAGVCDVVWVVSEKDAPSYEQDKNELCVYPMDWAEKYAAEHWMQPTPYKPGEFFGAFVGREWACLEAERRGCWGVLQLDDNITTLCLGRMSAPARRIVESNGGMALFADILTAVAKSTNGHMVGALLTSAITQKPIVSRPGFPYSLFIEKVGEGREHWYGPFEDDITHAFQYGTRAQSSTAIVVPMLRYLKESKSKSGMRSQYNHERAVQLQRIFPESANLAIMATKSNGMRTPGSSRVFHKMKANAIRNPQIICDRESYRAVQKYLAELIEEFTAMDVANNREKARSRAQYAGIGYVDN